MKTSILLLLLFLLNDFNVAAQTTINKQDLSDQYQEAIKRGDNARAFQCVMQFYNETHSFESAIILAGHYVGGIGTETNLENAAILYKSIADATKYDPNNEQAMLMIGFASRQYALMDFNMHNRFTVESLNYLLKADEIADDAFAQFFLGLIYMDVDHEMTNTNLVSCDIGKAIAYLEKSAKRNCLAAMTQLGDIYEMMGDENKAFSYWKRAANTPLYEATLNMADISSLFVNPNYNNEAIVIYAQNEAFYQLAKHYSDINDIDNAMVWVDKITIDEPLFLDQKAFCYAANGQKQKAIDTYMREYEISKDTDAIARLATTYYALWHDKDEALRLLHYIQGLGNTKAQTLIDMINSGY